MLTAEGYGVSAGSLHNPVARCADAGILRYCGDYYLSGVGLPGRMLVSSDLVRWYGPRTVFEKTTSWRSPHDFSLGEDEAHAPCIRYVGGRFHLYWNGIGHAVAERPLGPYIEPVDARFDGEIDPFLFVDEDGALVFYTVKFDRGNVIWAQSMETPDRLSGEPLALFGAAPGTWETRTGSIVEGPEVFRYRDRCYMLYAANHTGVQYGNYAIGCAVAEDPLAFDETTKYPWPVLERNEFRIDDDSTVLLQAGARGGPPWRFTTDGPEAGWNLPGFETPAEWEEGRGGFGFPARPGSGVQRVRTPWKSGEIWLRREFSIDRRPSPRLYLKIRLIGAAEIFLDGVPAWQGRGRVGPRLVPLSPEAAERLRTPGLHTIAVHARAPSGEERFVDVGLLDSRDRVPDDLIWNLGQPNVVRGPNGFERYLTYFALWNEGPHCQGIQRIHFFGDELFVDGPTGSRPPQYVPAPCPATFADRFETHRLDGIAPRPGEGWEYRGGWWYTLEGEARQFPAPWLQNPDPEARALPITTPASHYVFECWVRSLPGNRGTYGVVAWYRNEENQLWLVLDPVDRAWFWRTRRNGEWTRGPSNPLSDTFDFERFHLLRLINDGGRLDLWIDGVRATRDSPFQSPFSGAGRPGLLADAASAAYDGVLYTIGWEEYGSSIRGWQDVPSRKPKESLPAAAVDSRGISVEAAGGERVLVKGDPVPAGEFSAQVAFDTPPGDGRAGICPVWIGPADYLAAEIDPKNHRLIVRGRRNGRLIGPWEAALPGRVRLHLRDPAPRRDVRPRISASHCWKDDSIEAVADGRIPETSYDPVPKLTFWPNRGTSEWIRYDLDAPRALTGCELFWYDDRQTGGECRVPASWRISARKGNRWVLLAAGEGTEPVTTVRFPGIRTTSLRLDVTSRAAKSSGLYEWALLSGDPPTRTREVEAFLKRPARVRGIDLRFDPAPPFAPPASFGVSFLTEKGSLEPVSRMRTPAKGRGEFEPVPTRGLQIRFEVPAGKRVRVLEAHARIEGRPSYNLRAVRLPDRTIVFVDGKQVLEIPGAWPPARFGLLVRRTRAVFDGITCFRIDSPPDGPAD